MIEYEIVRSADRLGHIANEVNSAGVVGLDIETTALKPHHGEIRLLQLNTGAGKYVIDLFETKTLGPLPEALGGPAIKVIHTAAFEQTWFLAKYNRRLWPLFDTHRSSEILHAGKNYGHNLYDLYNRELKIAPEAPDMGGTDWSGALTKEHYDYAAEDIVHLPKLRESLKPKLAKAELNKIAAIEFGAVIGEAAFRNAGFRLDKGRWLELAEKNQKDLRELSEKLAKMLPHPKGQLGLPGLEPGFNFNSPDQIKASFARLGIDVESTDKNVLGMLSGEHEAIKVYLDWKKIRKYLDSFGPDYLENIDPVTGRIHCDYWPFTGAGRYACSKPNLQQIPRGKAFRRCFCPGPGKVLVICDYGQIELRIAAEISGDRILRSIYQRGEDAHQRTASLVSGVPYDQVTKGQRQSAKPVNFGLIYGLGAEKLVIYSKVSYDVDLTLAEAKRFIQRYFENYSGVRAWHQRVLRDAERYPIARTLWGRRRFLDPDKARNEFFNTPIQGTGADGLKRSLPIVWGRLLKYGDRAKMVHMVHDEIVVECDDDPELIAAVKLDLQEGMIEGIRDMLPHVPVEAEAGHGESWADK